MAMRGYDREGYEDLDEYEEDGEEQEVGEEEYEEEEAPQPTQEELEYLELRQRLKEAFRKQMKRESGSALASSRDKKKRLPNDNYGSFFGPSQPVIAQRVIQESRSLLENPHLATKVSKSHQQNNKSSASNPAGSKPRVDNHPPKVTNVLRTKVQMLKNTRDYSFLLSDDADVPASTKDPPPRNVSVSNSDSRFAQVPTKSKHSLSNTGRKVVNSHEERRPAPTGSRMQPKVVPRKLTSVSKPNLASLESRKQLGTNNANWPGRPQGMKGLPSKISALTTEKKVSVPVAKNSTPAVRKPPPSKLQSSVQKKPLEHKIEFQEYSKEKTMPKHSLSSSKPQKKPPPAKLSAHATLQGERPKQKPVRCYSDDDDDDDGGRAISMIRKMFGYNPNKYAGGDLDDDSDMEANFDDIMREERHSAQIAMKEDEEELRKIEEEEERERLRKETRKRKLSQR